MNINSILGASTASTKSISKSDIKFKLKTLGIPADVIAQGPDAVKKYASEHNIDLSSIQPPKKDSSSPNIVESNDTKKQEFEAKLVSLGIPENTVKQGKEAVEKYAKENNIQLPTPPKQGSKMNYLA